VLALEPSGNAQECIRFKTKKTLDRGKKSKDCFTTNHTNHTNMKQEKGSASPEPLRVTTPGGSSTSSTKLTNIVLEFEPYGNAQECLRFKTKKHRDRGKKSKDCFTTKNTNHTNHTNMKQEKGSPAPEPLRISTPGGSSTSSTTHINIVLALEP
jgi:hypothetical protein